MSKIDHGTGQLWSAADAGDERQLLKLLNRGVSPDGHVPWVESSPLARAGMKGHLNCLRLLISKADLNAKSSGMTALHWCVEEAQVDSLILLLEAGADAGALNADGESVLDSAFKYGSSALDLELSGKGSVSQRWGACLAQMLKRPDLCPGEDWAARSKSYADAGMPYLAAELAGVALGGSRAGQRAKADAVVARSGGGLAP